MSDLLDRFRRDYEEFRAAAAAPLYLERPALFSPAAGAQDAGTGTTAVARFGPLYLPLEYTNWVEEGVAHLESCYIGDWSSLSKAHIVGPQALEFLGGLGMNDLSRFEVGQIKHHVQLDDSGRVASEGILLRSAAQEFLYTAGSTDWLLWRHTLRRWDVEVADVTPSRFIFGVQGPKSIELLERLTSQSLRDLPFNRSRLTELSKMPVRVLRTGISGELGYEIHGRADRANAVWTAVVEAGAEFGLRQLGFRAQSIQHVEAGIATNGLDYFPATANTPGAAWQFKRGRPGGSFVPSGFTDYLRRPGELGWGGRGPLDHDFTGRDALVAEAESGGSRRVLRGLTWHADDVRDLLTAGLDAGELPEPMELPKVQGAVFDQVLVDGALVGVSSGRTLSPGLRSTISLVVIDRESAAAGTPVHVLWGKPGSRQRLMRATVTDLPFKPDRRRVDLSIR